MLQHKVQLLRCIDFQRFRGEKLLNLFECDVENVFGCARERVAFCTLSEELSFAHRGSDILYEPHEIAELQAEGCLRQRGHFNTSNIDYFSFFGLNS